MKPSILMLYAALKGKAMRLGDMSEKRANVLINTHVSNAIEQAARIDNVGGSISCAIACLINRASFSDVGFLMSVFRNSGLLFVENLSIPQINYMARVARDGFFRFSTRGKAIEFMREKFWIDNDMDVVMQKVFSMQLANMIMFSAEDPTVFDEADLHLKSLMPLFDRLAKRAEASPTMYEFLNSDHTSCEKAVSVMANIFYYVNRLGYQVTYDEAQIVSDPKYHNALNGKLSDTSMEFLNGLEEKFN